MRELLKIERLEERLDRLITYWHTDPPQHDGLDVEINPIALELAWRNFQLWHEEDKARRTDVDDSLIAAVKRNIDRFNQQRNDLIEKLDEAIMAELATQVDDATVLPINSETPGSIVDRISIMSLKVYHMDEDSRRDDIDDDHRQKSLHRLSVLKLQRFDLNCALEQLLKDFQSGVKRMKLYKQFKMYNDPALNPEMYRVLQPQQGVQS